MSCKYAKIVWKSEGIPRSSTFDDIYFSSSGGVEETCHVFLKGNSLPERWQERAHFIIAETGFGTGLNFLCTYALWQQTMPSDAFLHYISIEKYPMKKNDLSAVYDHIPHLKPYADALLNQYRPATTHHLNFEKGHVKLTLIIADVKEAFAQMSVQADAWFLDGFSPSKNPAMWSDNVLMSVAKHTRKGGTLATYTCAKTVKEGLKKAGFRVGKVPGFASKKHMLTATLPQKNIEKEKL